jgi:ubiquitin C-terminal hydrolase
MLLAKTRSDTLQDVIETTLAKTGYTEVVVRRGKASTPYTFNGHDIVAVIWIPKWAMRTYELASYIQLDCSHWATRPFVYCVPQAIIRNEAVPLGFVMTPTESAWTYAIFMYRLWQFLSRDKIPRRPVLSDQGPGLGLFCSFFWIVQFFCHRHIIENWGASGAIGMLVTRVLRLLSKAEFIKLRPHFVAQAEALHRKGHVSRDAFEKFREWLWNLCDDFVHGIWHRILSGIARCSNHAERFHRTVKDAIKAAKVRTLARRLLVLHAEIIKRYEGYSQSNHRSLRRALALVTSLHKPQQNVCQRPECRDFCSMMTHRYAVKFPCPHTAEHGLGEVEPLPDIAQPQVGEGILQWSERLEWDYLNDNIEVAPLPKEAAKGKKRGGSLHDSLGVFWDDEAGPDDFIGDSDRIPHWQVSRSIVTGVFYLLARSRRYRGADKLAVSDAIFSHLKAAYPFTDAVDDSEEQRVWLANFASDWFSWAITSKNPPVSVRFPDAPFHEDEPVATDPIVLHLPWNWTFLNDRNPFRTPRRGKVPPWSACEQSKNAARPRSNRGGRSRSSASRRSTSRPRPDSVAPPPPEEATAPAIPSELDCKSVCFSVLSNVPDELHLPTKPLGLLNDEEFHNTCYSNALLQCLARIDDLTCYFCLGPSAAIADDTGIGFAYRALQIAFWTGSTCATPCAFALRYYLPKEFQTWDHKDPEEFLCHLLDGLTTHLQRLGLHTGGSTVIEDLFQGKTSRVIETVCCKTVQADTQTFLVHDVPIISPGDDDFITLEACLASQSTECFCAVEDHYACPKCGGLSDAVHLTAFSVCPRILILCLLRFRKDLTKIRSPVSFPEFLSLPLNDGTGKSCQYWLRALDEHYGTLRGGHHIATVRVGQEQPAVWYRCNDTKISPGGPRYESNEAVYLLFYDRLDLLE